MQTYAAAHTHTHSFPHTGSPMGSGSADTKRLSRGVKGHPGRGQIRTLGFFSVNQADIPSHTHTFSTPAILLLCSVGQAGSWWATTRAGSYYTGATSKAGLHVHQITSPRRLLQTNVLSQLRGWIRCTFSVFSKPLRSVQ